METIIKNICNPATREINNAVYTLKKWTHFVDRTMDEKFMLYNEDSVWEAYYSFVHWVFLAGEVSTVHNENDAQAYIARVLNIADDMMFGEVFDRDNWFTLKNQGFAIPFFVRHDYRTTDKPCATISKAEFSDDMEDENDEDESLETLFTEDELNELNSGLDVSEIIPDINRKITTGVKKSGYTKDMNGWKLHNIGAGKYLSNIIVCPSEKGKWMVCYSKDKTQVPPLAYPVEPGRERKPGRASRNHGDTYNIAVMNKYAQETKTSRTEVRMMTLERWISLTNRK